eukprot:SAG11_NODE_4606_length_1838_cov_1.256469_2_plen_89_part_00
MSLRRRMIDDGTVRAVRRESGVVAVPLEPGDLLFFSSLLPHGTPSNLDGRNDDRRALQFHYTTASATSGTMPTEFGIPHTKTGFFAND